MASEENAISAPNMGCQDGLMDRDKKLRLSKRLAYLLRYGARKEGLKASDQGYVDLEDLMLVGLLKDEILEDVREEILTSEGARGPRFEMKISNGRTFVRALYNRRFEECIHHEDCKVLRLKEQCISLICNDLDAFSFEDFPDESIIRSILHRLKRQKRLNNRALRCLVSNSLETLDLSDTYLTNASLKSLPGLQNLDISECYQLTSKSYKAIPKYLTQLRTLNLSRIENLDKDYVVYILEGCSFLERLILRRTNLKHYQMKKLLHPDMISKCHFRQHCDNNTHEIIASG